MAVIAFGSETPFGALTGWNYTSASVTVDKERANSISRIGNETASKLYDVRTNVTASLVAAGVTAPTVPAKLGEVVNGWLITSIQLGTSREGFATMQLTAHNHAVAAHSAETSPSKIIAHGITLVSGFGAQDFMGGTAGDNASVRSGSITIECQHVDETDAAGDHLVGENYTPMLTAETEWVGVPSVAAVAGWDVTSEPNPTENTGFESASVSGTKALTFS